MRMVRRFIVGLSGTALLMTSSASVAQNDILNKGFVKDRTFFRLGRAVSVGDIFYSDPGLWNHPNDAAFDPYYHSKTPVVPYVQDQPWTDDIKVGSRFGLSVLIPIAGLLSPALGASLQHARTVTLTVKAGDGLADYYNDDTSADEALQALQSSKSKDRQTNNVIRRVEQDAVVAKGRWQLTHYWIVEAVYHAKALTWSHDNSDGVTIGVGCKSAPVAPTALSAPAAEPAPIKPAQNVATTDPTKTAAASDTKPTVAAPATASKRHLTGGVNLSATGVAVDAKLANDAAKTAPTASPPAASSADAPKCGLGSVTAAIGGQATTTGSNVAYAVKLRPIFISSKGTLYLPHRSATQNWKVPTAILHSS